MSSKSLFGIPIYQEQFLIFFFWWICIFLSSKLHDIEETKTKKKGKRKKMNTMEQNINRSTKWKFFDCQNKSTPIYIKKMTIEMSRKIFIKLAQVLQSQFHFLPSRIQISCNRWMTTYFLLKFYINFNLTPVRRMKTCGKVECNKNLNQTFQIVIYKFPWCCPKQSH